jgi:hypothetical protein
MWYLFAGGRVKDEIRAYVINPAFSFYIGMLPAVKNEHCLPESQGFSSKGA